MEKDRRQQIRTIEIWSEETRARIRKAKEEGDLDKVLVATASLHDWQKKLVELKESA